MIQCRHVTCHACACAGCAALLDELDALRTERNRLRDRFAMAALPSFLTLEAEELGYEGAAEAAYGVADAMLRAREGK